MFRRSKQSMIIKNSQIGSVTQNYFSINIEDFIRLNEHGKFSPAKPVDYRWLPEYNLHFTGRERELEQISKALSEKDSVCSITQTISGLGGVGKSQLALAYAHAYAAENTEAIVWWVNCEHPIDGICEFLQHFGFPADLSAFGANNPLDKAVQRYLIDWYNRYHHWLLVFDNVDSYSDIQPYLPGSLFDGGILITTRNKTSFLDKAELIDLSAFSEQESLNFLQKRLGSIYDDNLAKQLSEKLGFFPLALEQVAAYIRMQYNNDKEILQRYLVSLEQKGISYLDKGKPNYYKSVIGKTWLITFEKLDNNAKRLMYYCSYMGSENLPLFVDSPLATDFEDVDIFFEALADLKGYSLISVNNDMHLLVQQVIREFQDDNSPYLNRLADIMRNSLSSEDISIRNYELFRSLVNHCNKLIEHMILTNNDDIESNNKIVKLSDFFGIWAYKIGHYEQAIYFSQIACSQSEKIDGLNSINLCLPYASYAAALFAHGYRESALEILEKAMEIFSNEGLFDEIQKNIPAEEAFIFCTIANSLGRIYQNFILYEEAEILYIVALNLLNQISPEGSKIVVMGYSNLGTLYVEKAEYKEALEQFMIALEMVKVYKITECPVIGILYDNIGNVYRELYNFASALAYHEKGRVIFEKILGLWHVNTATCHMNIGMTYVEMGELDKALLHYEKDLEIKKKVLRTNHPEVSTSYNNIGGIYMRKKNYVEALKYYKRALNISKATLGEDAANTALHYSNIGGAYRELGDYEKALSCVKKAIEICKATYGLEDIHTALIYEEMALTLSGTGDYVQALEFSKKGYEIIKNKLGIEHPKTIKVVLCQELVQVKMRIIPPLL